MLRPSHHQPPYPHCSLGKNNKTSPNTTPHLQLVTPLDPAHQWFMLATMEETWSFPNRHKETSHWKKRTPQQTFSCQARLCHSSGRNTEKPQAQGLWGVFIAKTNLLLKTAQAQYIKSKKNDKTCNVFQPLETEYLQKLSTP